MHELSICRDLVALIVEATVNENVEEVKTVFLELGKFSHLEESSLMFSFEAVAAGTIASKATLSINRCEGVGRCTVCEHQQTLIERFETCKKCGEFPITLVDGDQMRLKSLEVS